MIRSLYIAATGMEAQQVNIDVISNNLSNVNTNSFKKSRADFQDLLYQELKTPGASSGSGTMIPTGVLLGSGAKLTAVGKNFSMGDIRNTGNELDIAIEGKGFLQITRPDGTTSYTRDGAFKRSSEGLLVTNDGYSLTPEINIPADTVQITISEDGIVSALAGGAVEVTEVGRIELANFSNPQGLKNIGGNQYIETAASGSATSGTPGQGGLGTINQSFLESSNVNIAEELINMIIAQRAYEINSKAIQTSDEMLQLANNLKR